MITTYSYLDQYKQLTGFDVLEYYSGIVTYEGITQTLSDTGIVSQTNTDTGIISQTNTDTGIISQTLEVT